MVKLENISQMHYSSTLRGTAVNAKIQRFPAVFNKVRVYFCLVAVSIFQCQIQIAVANKNAHKAVQQRQ